MTSRKSNVQITLDSTSITVLKAILHQVEQAKTKQERRQRDKHSTQDLKGQLALLAVITDEAKE